MARDVFISHQSEFKPWVEWLAHALQAHGHPVFLDKWHLVPGETWVEGLDRGLREAKAAVLVATPEAVNSGWVKREHARLTARAIGEPGFRYVPLVFGNLPALPFLSDVQCVDCRDVTRHHEWFHQLVCGLVGVPPGGQPAAYPGLTPPPQSATPDPAHQAPAEVAFVQRVMQHIGRATCPPVMITSPGRRHQGPVIAMLRSSASVRFGAAAVVHAVPPFSTEGATAPCFAELGRQCGLDDDTGDSVRFQAALGRRIAAAGGLGLFLLLSGFENAHAEFRLALAKCLRGLSERHAADLRVVLVGGERLVEQSFGNGESSFLSGATVMAWPHPSVADVLAWQASDFPHRPLPQDHAQDLLATTGGHGSLVRHGLEHWAEHGPPPRWVDWAVECPELWDSWNRLRRSAGDLSVLRAALDRAEFGRVALWPPDPIVRSLYWSDLLAEDSRRKLVWRCEAVREVGREVLG